MREKLKKLPIPVTVLICILLAVLFIAVLKGSRALVEMTPLQQATYYLAQAISELPPLLLFTGLAVCFGYGFLRKENRSGWTDGFYRGAFCTVYCGASLGVGIVRVFMTDGDLVEFWEVLVFAVAMALVGIVEELVFRGIILNILVDKFGKTRGGITAALIVDGVLFGALHISNIISGAKPISACIQALGAAAVGILLAYIYIRTRNFWLVAIFHALMDFGSLLSSGIHEGGNLASSVDGLAKLGPVTVAIYLLYLIPIFIFLRKKNMQKVVLLESGGEAEETPSDILTYSRIGMIFGIISVGMALMMGYSIGFAALGLTACRLAKKKGLQNRMTKAGTILSIVGMILGVLSVIGFSLLYSNIDMTKWQEFL